MNAIVKEMKRFRTQRAAMARRQVAALQRAGFGSPRWFDLDKKFRAQTEAARLAHEAVVARLRGEVQP